MRKGGKSQLPEAAKTLRGMQLGYGTLLFLARQTPSPTFKFNIFVDYDIYKGNITYKDSTVKVLSRLDYKLEGRQALNTKILEAELVDLEAGKLE